MSVEICTQRLAYCLVLFFVYELVCKRKLYEIEELSASYLRISKAQIVNADRIERLTPLFNGRLEAILKNGEKVIISRQYVPELKKHFGV